MALYPETLRIVVEYIDHHLPEQGCFFINPFCWIPIEVDPFQALLEGRGDAALFPAAAVSAVLPEELEIAAVVRKNAAECTSPDHPLQSMSAIVVRRERADLKVLFAPMDIRQSYGKVYLTGAGAGSREYLTLKADRLLVNAGVIFYDDLIDTELLEAYGAEKIYVGKRKGHHHAEQDSINRQLYRAATKKQIVVRLKGGDPLIFGRGGEEMAYLNDRHIDVEVVPGVSALQSAAASAGIPLTQRGVSGGVTLQSAHNVLAGGTPRTLVYFMCASRLSELQRMLLQDGIDPELPVALVYKAGFFDELVTITTVSAMNNVELVSPLLAIIGWTAALYRKRNKILHTGVEPYQCLLPGKIVPLAAVNSAFQGLCDVDLDLFSGIAFTDPEKIDDFLAAFGKLPAHLVLYADGQECAELLRAKGYGRVVMALDLQR
jgi:uroporphyrin-III C-methyltransferase